MATTIRIRRLFSDITSGITDICKEFNKNFPRSALEIYQEDKYHVGWRKTNEYSPVLVLGYDDQDWIVFGKKSGSWYKIVDYGKICEEKISSSREMSNIIYQTLLNSEKEYGFEKQKNIFPEDYRAYVWLLNKFK